MRAGATVTWVTFLNYLSTAVRYPAGPLSYMRSHDGGGERRTRIPNDQHQLPSEARLYIVKARCNIASLQGLALINKESKPRNQVLAAVNGVAL